MAPLSYERLTKAQLEKRLAMSEIFTRTVVHSAQRAHLQCTGVHIKTTLFIRALDEAVVVWWSAGGAVCLLKEDNSEIAPEDHELFIEV